MLANQYGLSGDDVKGAAFLSLYQLKMSAYGLELSSVNEAINKVIAFLNEEHGLSVKQDKTNEPLIKLLVLIATNIRRPWNRGWSNYELLGPKILLNWLLKWKLIWKILNCQMRLLVEFKREGLTVMSCLTSLKIVIYRQK